MGRQYSSGNSAMSPSSSWSNHRFSEGAWRLGNWWHTASHVPHTALAHQMASWSKWQVVTHASHYHKIPVIFPTWHWMDIFYLWWECTNVSLGGSAIHFRCNLFETTKECRWSVLYRYVSQNNSQELGANASGMWLAFPSECPCTSRRPANYKIFLQNDDKRAQFCYLHPRPC